MDGDEAIAPNSIISEEGERRAREGQESGSETAHLEIRNGAWSGLVPMRESSVFVW